MIRSFLISREKWLLTNESRRRAWIGGLMLASVLGMSVPSTATAEDRLAGDLFSQITMSDTTDSRTSAPSLGRKENQILGVVSLAKVLSRNQIKSDLQSRTVLVTVTDLLPKSSRSPSEKLRLAVDAEAGHIEMTLPLQNVQAAAIAEGPKLMALLSMLSDFANIQLTAADQIVALRTSFSNRELTSDRVQTAAERLVLAGQKTENLLSAAGGAPKESATGVAVTKPGVSTKSSTVVAKSPSLVGTWSAKSSSTDAWAMRLNGDNSFTMVHTRGDKNSVSRGSYQIESEQLAVREKDGVTLRGPFNRTSDKSFSWELQNERRQTLKTLRFVKK
jgi:hypothetical protein